MEQDIIRALKYFSHFDYYPTFEEIFAFLRRKTTPQNLKKALESMIKSKRLSQKAKRYTTGEYLKNRRWVENRVMITRNKLHKAIRFLILIALFPQIKLVGLSGSASMANAKKDDDIDLFVITAQNRLWTGRLISVLLANLFGRRKFNDRHTADKLCLNLFFDEKDLAIKAKKRTLYVAHEVLQMKPIIDKDSTHKRFIKANRWVFRFFPNVESTKLDTNQFFPDSWDRLAFARSEEVAQKWISSRSKIGDLFEALAKLLQMRLINLHKTKEIVTSTQLWFFPDDYEAKLKAEKA